MMKRAIATVATAALITAGGAAAASASGLTIIDNSGLSTYVPSCQTKTLKTKLLKKKIKGLKGKQAIGVKVKKVNSKPCANATIQVRAWDKNQTLIGTGTATIKSGKAKYKIKFADVPPYTKANKVGQIEAVIQE